MNETSKVTRPTAKTMMRMVTTTTTKGTETMEAPTIDPTTQNTAMTTTTTTTKPSIASMYNNYDSNEVGGGRMNTLSQFNNPVSSNDGVIVVPGGGASSGGCYKSEVEPPFSLPTENNAPEHVHRNYDEPYHNDDDDNDADHDQEEEEDDEDDNISATDLDEDPLKLFVGQIPKQMSEEDIFPTFDAFGPLKDVTIIREKHTGIHRGCAFVTYWSSMDAQKAQLALHNQFTFPGAKRPTQVKPAEPLATSEKKLFIGMLSRTAGEEDVRQLFERFGEIREIHMIRSKQDGTSKCSAFLRFFKRESAIQAIATLNNALVMEGAPRPLIVKFADSNHQRQQRQLCNTHDKEILASSYPGYMTPHLIMNMHPPPPGSIPHHHPYSHMPLPFSHPPPQLHYPQGPQLSHPYMYHHHSQHAQNTLPYLPPQHVPTSQYGGPQQPQNVVVDSQNNNHRPLEGPAGANLFVYHLPPDLTDADLATAFNSFGTVLSAKVYVDKFTGESKGFGFVSYDSVLSAEAAIEQMNGFQIGNKRLKVQHKRMNYGSFYPNFWPPQTPHITVPPMGVPSHLAGSGEFPNGTAANGGGTT